MSAVCLKRLELPSGALLEFVDRSNRYFGDYHRVLIEVELVLMAEEGPQRLRYQKPLQRMGVASADVEAEREALIENFLTTARPYMERPEYLTVLSAMLDKPGQQVWKRLSAELV